MVYVALQVLLCLLWQSIRRKRILGLQFYRQKPILNFIVDFYCPKVNLVIECDGGQHYTEEGLGADRARDQALSELGLMVLRFSNHEILTEIDGVVEVIYEFFTSNRFKINNILLIDF